jgi:hypothetical protein
MRVTFRARVAQRRERAGGLRADLHPVLSRTNPIVIIGLAIFSRKGVEQYDRCLIARTLLGPSGLDSRTQRIAEPELICGRQVLREVENSIQGRCGHRRPPQWLETCQKRRTKAKDERQAATGARGKESWAVRYCNTQTSAASGKS